MKTTSTSQGHAIEGAARPEPRLSRQRRLARTGIVGAALVGAGVGLHVAPAVSDGLRHEATSVWDSTLGAPTDIQKYQDEFQAAKADPADVKPGTLVSYMVGFDTSESEVAAKIAAPDQVETVTHELEAQDNQQGIFEPGPKLLEISTVDMQNPEIAKHMTPFPEQPRS